MALINPLPPDDAAPAAREVYAEFALGMGCPTPPNFILTQGHAPAVARAVWEMVRGVLLSGSLPRWVKDLVLVAVSRDRNCLYCAAAHLACCRAQGVDETTLQALASDIEQIPDPRVRAIARFAIKCSRNPATLLASDYDALRAHGLSEPELVEVVAVSAVAVNVNILADAVQMSLDPMFALGGAGPH